MINQTESQQEIPAENFSMTRQAARLLSAPILPVQPRTLPAVD